MDPHVLVLAMSTLNDKLLFAKNDKGEMIPAENRYRFVGADGPEGELYKGLGQLEPVPQFIASKEKITHIIILETKLTKKNISREIWDDLVSAFEREGRPLRNRHEDCPPSPVSFFLDRMASFGIDAEPIHIDIDENNPEAALEQMLIEIRKLYALCDNKDNWRLWLDVHGGFRDTSMAMFMLMQMLSAQDMHGQLKVYEKQEIIPVTAVYTVQFSDSKAKDTEHSIVDRTNFYRRYTSDTLREYMNWGQYLHTLLEPYDGDEPYCFISYKHGEAELTRMRFLSVLKDADIRYWFDDGIHLKKDWRETLAKKNANCKVFVLLLSKGYRASLECLRELRAAVDSGKPILIVSIDGTSIWTANGFSVKDNGECIAITDEEAKAFAAEQHIDLSSDRYNNDGVFQRSKLEGDLLKLNMLDECRKMPDSADA